MATAHISETQALLGRRLSSACIFSEDEVQGILKDGFDSLDECEVIDGVNYFSAVQILNVVSSAIWLRFYGCGHDLQGNALMTHALEGWR